MTAPIDLRVSEQNADADETSSKRGTDEWREGKRAWLDDPAPPEVVDARPGLESNARHDTLDRHRIDGDRALGLSRNQLDFRVQLWINHPGFAPTVRAACRMRA